MECGNDMFCPPKVIDPKTPQPKVTEANQNIQVFVRCRPINPSEKKANVDLITEKRTIKISPQNKLYAFDDVFNEKASQLQIYRTVVQPLVDQAMEGYNCTVFAYGLTGTGKTYTMVGERSDTALSWEEDPLGGVIPRAVDQLLDELNTQNSDFSIRVSFLELYNEDVYDLLSPMSDSTKLRIYNDTERKGSVIVSGLVEMAVNTKEEIYEILEKGSKKRQTAPTLMNACSSRSHSIFSVTVLIKETTHEGEEIVKTGKLNLVDLAGSENIGRSGAVDERARESSNINKSLLTLGRVITSLVEKASHVPYRESKLTRLLQDSLGGKTKTSIIATISPSADDLEDTLSTLEYAQRAKKITNKPEINLKFNKKTLLNDYLNEINRLQRDLEAARDKKGIFMDPKNLAMMETKLKDQETNIEVMEARMEHLASELVKMGEILKVTQEDLDERIGELEATKENLEQVSTKLATTEEVLEKKAQEVEEKAVLIDAHLKTEKNLLEQAFQVKKVTDKVVDDNDKLFNKLNQYRGIESYNSRFIHDLISKHDHQTYEMSNFGSYIIGAIANGRRMLDDIFQANGKKATESISKLEANNSLIPNRVTDCLATISQATEAMMDKFKVFTTNIKSISQAYVDDIMQHIELHGTRCKDDKAQLQSLVTQLLTGATQSRANQEELIGSFISDLSTNSNSSNQALGCILDLVVSSYKEKCIALDDMKDRNFELEEELETMRSSAQAVSEALSEHINKIDQAKSSIPKKYDSIVDKMKTIDEDLSKQLPFHVNDCVRKNKAHETHLVEACKQLDQKSLEDWQSVMDNGLALQQANQNMADLTDALRADLQTRSQQIAVSLGPNIESLEEQVESTMLEQTEKMNLLGSDVRDVCNDNAEQVSRIGEQLQHLKEATISSYSKMEKECSQMKQSQDFQIKDCAQMVKDLQSHGFRTYQASGETPQKVTYNYPRNFATTSPHERILNRLRNQQQS